MTLDPLESFDFEDDLFDGYDPFANLDIAIDDSEPKDTSLSSEETIEVAPEAVEVPASERIAKVLHDMKARKRVIFQILNFLREPKHSDELQPKVDEFQTYDFSVFNATNYSNILEKAGAIAKCTETGELLGADYKQAPEIIELDGIEYYKPAPRPQIYWQITEDGQAVLDADNPLERMIRTIDTDKPEYLEIYMETLRYCETEAGHKTLEVQEYLRSLDKFKDVKVFAARYLSRLEDANGVVWAGSWITTDFGKQCLAHYAESKE